jgi:hypothetical protein
MGLLAGFIGGAAKGASSALEAGMKEDALNRQRVLDDQSAKARTDYAAQVELKKQEFLDRLRAQREEANALRDSKMQIQAQEGAESTLKDRGFADFKSKLGDSALSEAELRKLYESQYHDKTVGEFEGADQFDVKESSRASEELRQLQGLGAGSGLLNSANARVKDAKTAERQSEVDAFNRRKQEALERKWEEDRKHQTERDERRHQQTLAVVGARASSGGGSGGSDNEGMDKKLKAAYDVAMKNQPKPPTSVSSSAKKAYEAQLADWEKKYGSVIQRYEEAVGISTPPPVTPENKPAPAAKRGVFNPATGKVEWK